VKNHHEKRFLPRSFSTQLLSDQTISILMHIYFINTSYIMRTRPGLVITSTKMPFCFCFWPPMLHCYCQVVYCTQTESYSFCFQVWYIYFATHFSLCKGRVTVHRKGWALQEANANINKQTSLVHLNHFVQ